MVSWNAYNARHLLGRCLFGYTHEDLTKAMAYDTVDAFVDQRLLSDQPLPASPGSWVNETPVPDAGPVDEQRYRALYGWWVGHMLNEGQTMRERMVLFWHNHFTSTKYKVYYPQYLYHQNQLYRSFAWGNIRQLTKEVTIDPAMLIYLDGASSTQEAPNENYARELLELFTLGIGNYTETDVKQAALALTGWEVTGLRAVFKRSAFADSSKTFLGRTGNFSHTDIADIIFTMPQAAEFLCRKLYTEFVYYKPNESFVKQMAAVLRANQYEIRPVLRYLFTAEEFFRPEYRGAKIKSPTDLLIGSMKAFGLMDFDPNHLLNMGRALQQELFNPPSVQGWLGQREWISSNTYPKRGAFTDALIDGRLPDGAYLKKNVNALTYARSYDSSEKADQFVRDIAAYFITYPISESRKKFLMSVLLDGTTAANWSTNAPMAETRIQRFFKAVMRLPEYQLC